MALVSPFDWLSVKVQKWALAASFALTAVLQYAWSTLDRPLRTPVAPKGLLSFEVAGTPAAARTILDSWGHDGQIRAATALGLDYLFLLAYSGTIGLAAVVVARRLAARRWAWRLGIGIAWLQVPAAAFDAIENYALLQTLMGSSAEVWPRVARLAAKPKFLFNNAGVVYVIAGVGLALVLHFAGRLGGSHGANAGRRLP